MLLSILVQCRQEKVLHIIRPVDSINEWILTKTTTYRSYLNHAGYQFCICQKCSLRLPSIRQQVENQTHGHWFQKLFMENHFTTNILKFFLVWHCWFCYYCACKRCFHNCQSHSKVDNHVLVTSKIPPFFNQFQDEDQNENLVKWEDWKSWNIWNFLDEFNDDWKIA